MFLLGSVIFFSLYGIGSKRVLRGLFLGGKKEGRGGEII